MAARPLVATLGLAALLACAAPARAAEGTGPAGTGLRFHLDLGWDYGFTTLVTAYLSDGSSKRIAANDGLSLHAGGEYGFGSASVRATAGFKATAISASNATIWSTAYPVEVLGFWELSRARLGGGLSLALGPRISGSGDASALDARFDPSLGVVLQGEWVALRTARGGSLGVGARFTWQRFRATSTGETVGANALGLVLGWTP